MAILRFETNIPKVVQLKYATGKLTPSSMDGRPADYFYTFADGTQTYLPSQANDLIQSMGIRPYQPFEICKRKIGRENIWQIRLMDAGPAATEPTSATASAPKSTNGHQHSNGNGGNAQAYDGRGAIVPPPPIPFPEVESPAARPTPAPQTTATSQSNRLMGCFLAAIDAIAEAQAYAKRKELGITFTSEDVRAAALSCYINSCKEGR